MPDEDRLRYATNRKEVGTCTFKEGRLRLARERYRRTANFLAIFFSGMTQAAPRDLLQTCWLNAAQCEIALKNHAAARRYCDAVLRLDPDNIKALFRRAIAYLALGAPQLQVIQDLSKVVARDPENRAAKKLLWEAQQAQKHQDRGNHSMFKKACADLIDEFQAIKDRLESACLGADHGAAQEVLKDLISAIPRLTA